jgi:tetraacyldisaccharide 4'-kinase
MPALFHDLVTGRRRGPLAAAARLGLSAASLPYGVGVRVRNTLFDLRLRKSVRLPVPVVCVGNLSLGGTGKTPMVEWVARQLVELGHRPAVVSRGYGGDEARVLEDNLPDVPHLCGADRATVGALAVEELEADCVVLDDGFQHRRLHRDLDLVLIDSTRPPADDHLFPRGTLREPVGGLSRAGAVVFTRFDQRPPGTDPRGWLARRFPDLPTATATHAPLELLVADGTAHVLDLIREKPVALVSGIGNPSAFRRTVTDMGLSVVAERAFADHHPYTRADVDGLRTWAAATPPDAVVLTTQKDMVKLRLTDLAARPVYALRVGIRFLDGERHILDRLRRAVGEGVPA